MAGWWTISPADTVRHPLYLRCQHLHLPGDYYLFSECAFYASVQNEPTVWGAWYDEDSGKAKYTEGGEELFKEGVYRIGEINLETAFPLLPVLNALGIL